MAGGVGKEPNDVEVAVTNETDVRILGRPYSRYLQLCICARSPIELAKRS